MKAKSSVEYMYGVIITVVAGATARSIITVTAPQPGEGVLVSGVCDVSALPAYLLAWSCLVLPCLACLSALVRSRSNNPCRLQAQVQSRSVKARGKQLRKPAIASIHFCALLISTR